MTISEIAKHCKQRTGCQVWWASVVVRGHCIKCDFALEHQWDSETLQTEERVPGVMGVSCGSWTLVLIVTLFVTISEKVNAPKWRRRRPLWFTHIVLIVILLIILILILLSLPTAVMVIHLIMIFGDNWTIPDIQDSVTREGEIRTRLALLIYKPVSKTAFVSFIFLSFFLLLLLFFFFFKARRGFINVAEWTGKAKD